MNPINPDTPQQPEVSPEAQVPVAAAAPAAPSDVLKSSTATEMEVVLPDGRVVLMQKPNRPINLFVTRVLGRDSMNEALTIYYRALLYVKSVNGIAVQALNTPADFEALYQRLGDEGLEVIADHYWLFQALAQTKADDVKKS